MITKYIFLICLMCISIQSYCIEKSDSLYQVTRIKSKGDYYEIHVKKNGFLFLIISKKSPVIISNLKLLKRGSYYYFDFNFGYSNKNLNEEKTIPLSGIANYLDIKDKPVFIDGNTKIRITKRFLYRWYTTKNLIGLYYIPNPH